MDIRVGDWIRFYDGGVLVIGIVHYITRNVLGEMEWHTERGTTQRVFEVRHAEEPANVKSKA